MAKWLLGSWVLVVAHAGIGPVHAQTVEYIHTDALGTPVAVTDVNRNVIERSEYEPYGQLLNRPISNGPGYTGHVMDAATGLTYMQQRYYDPGIGRFLSVDPITANGNTGVNFNRYWYANNNPYRFTDPDGRETNPVSGMSYIEDDELRTNASNPRVGMYGRTRSTNNWNNGSHAGVDIRAPAGTRLVAPISGKVLVFKSDKGGNVIYFDAQRNGATIRIGMAHLSSIHVRSGDTVVEGAGIGRSGETGNARGLPKNEQHVHLSVRVNGQLKDPQQHFKENPSNIPSAPPRMVDVAANAAGPTGTARSLRFDP